MNGERERNNDHDNDAIEKFALMEQIHHIEDLFEVFLAESRRPGDISTPLVSPWAVKRVAEILEVDVADEPYQVTNMKTFLKTFLLQYRLEGSISSDELTSCLTMVKEEREKHRREPFDTAFGDISDPAAVQFFCVECGAAATRYCANCKECLCTPCSDRMHAKGNRALHHINAFIPCSMCRKAPSMLQCTYTFKTFCRNCFSKRHAKTLPTHILDLLPVRIDYTLGFNTPDPSSLQEELISEISVAVRPSLAPDPGSALPMNPGEDWHPFIDSSGVLYYYNFRTQESMRRPNIVSRKCVG